MKIQFMQVSSFKILFLSLILMAASQAQWLNIKFKYKPLKPKPRDLLILNCNLSNTIPENTEVAFIVYSVRNGILDAEEYPLKKSDTSWEGEYHIPDSSQALGIKFIITNSKFSDQIRQKTFTVQLYDKDQKLLKGTKAASAFIISHGLINNKIPDEESAYKLYNEEILENPPIMKYYIRPYCYLINNTEGRGSKNATSHIQKVLSSFEKSKLNEEEMINIQYVYDKYLNNEQMSKRFHDLIVSKHPLGILVQNEEIKRIYNSSDIEKERSLLKAFLKKFPLSKSCNSLRMDVLIKLYKQSDFNEARKYLKSININFNDEEWIRQYGAFAKCVEICLKNCTDLSFIENLNDISLRLARKFFVLPRPYPNWLTENQYKEKSKKEATCSSFIVAVKVYNRTKGFEEALKLAEEGYKLSDACVELNRLYARLLIDNNKSEKGLEIISQMIIEGELSDDILQMLRSVYLKVNGTNNGYEKYLSKLKNKFLISYKERIKSSLINKPAPQFVLTNLEGDIISLSDYKGKVVVVDFWATWCQHCKVSFPLLEKAISNYSDQTGVVFLFIDTWETSANRKENAAKYIKENNYPFNCLVDENNRVAADYQVTGLPTKIFIDKQGNIRYKSVGVDNEMILNEINVVLELLTRQKG